jgi:hypothetical protein
MSIWSSIGDWAVEKIERFRSRPNLRQAFGFR